MQQNASKTASSIGVSQASQPDADPYAGVRAEQYDHHHRKNSRARWTTRREQGVLARALKAVGPVDVALDLPCGAGRFWPVFQEQGVKRLIAGDISEGMLNVAAGNRINEHYPEQQVLTSALNIQLPDKSVDFAACMRFYHHLSLPEDRLKTLQELSRVSRSYIALSLWVDGNLGALRRSRKPAPQVKAGYGRRICRKRNELPGEFAEAGLSIVDHYDVWPGISMWRLYLLSVADEPQLAG